MKSQLNKILKITFVILFFSLSKSYSVEDLSEFTDAISEAREGFDKVSAASTEQSKIIDEAFKEIDKATAIAEEAINNNNTEDAIKTLEFVERSLTDVESIIPQEFSSDMSNIDTSALSKEDMDTVNELTAQMKSSKAVKEKEFKSNLIEINLKGIDTASISEKLNELGVNTIQLDIVLDKDKKIETWTKQDWANSYTGSILSYDGKEVVADKAVGSRMAELEEKFQKNATLIENKKNELSLLNSQLSPVNAELESLNEKKSSLTAQYNIEIEKLSTANLTNLETAQSVEISSKLKSELDNITNDVLEAEQKSASLKENISKLNLELDVEKDALNKISSDLANTQKELNNTFSAISSKQSQLDSLLNNDLSKTNEVLSQQLNELTREKDFIESKFDKVIDKEVAALERYYTALGNVDSKYFAEEIEFSIREVGVILDADPRKARAFEIEKYATFAGLSKDFIQNSIQAVNNDDWDAQKDIYREVITGLSKNPEWQVDVPSEAELRVMIAEDKAIQEATLASLQVAEMQRNWNNKLAEEAKEYAPFRQASISSLKHSSVATMWGSEKTLYNQELEKVLASDTELETLKTEYESVKKELDNIKETNTLYAEEVKKQTQPLQEELAKEYDKINELNQAYNEITLEKYDYIESIGGTAAVYRDRGNPNYGEWTKTINNFNQQAYDVGQKVQDQYKVTNDIRNQILQIKVNAPKVDTNRWSQLQFEVMRKGSEVISKESALNQEARKNAIAIAEESREKYDEIMAKEDPEMNAVKAKVSSILKGVPTFADKADALAGTEAVSLRAQLNDIAAGTKTENAALAAARNAMSQMGKTTGSQFMTGPTWEMSNVKAAAIVRSKRYEYVDDYAYINAEYADPLQLSTADRKEAEQGLKDLLGVDNPKLNALNKQATSLKTEIATNNAQLANIDKDISSLKNEIGSIQSSEKDLRNQIASLNKDLASKQSLIDKKTQSLSELQKNLDPINDKITELETKKSELDTNIQNEINAISQNLEKSPTAKSTEIDKLNADYKAQMASLDEQISNFENQAKDLNQTAKSINDEIKSYEIETPQITQQIASLSEQYQYLDNVKANLAMATAKNIGIKVDEKAIKSLGKLDGKAIISIKGTQLVRVVDEKLLKDKAKDFIDPISTFSLNTKIYSAEALKPEVFVVEEVTQAYSKAKTAREIARENLAAVEAKSGATKEEIQAAEAAVAEAKYAEIAAGQAFVSNTGTASLISQKQTLENLKAIRNTPGMNKWDVRRTEAAIKAAEAQIAGKSYNYQNALSSIKNQETKWNAWRADLYRKDIEIAKAAGKTREASLLQRDLERFETRLVDERKAFESVQTKQSEYLEALNNVATKNVALTGVSFQEAASSSIQSSVQSSSKSISAEARATVQAEASAIQSAGASTQQASAYAAAKAARLEARANWDAAVASGNKAAAQAAEDAFMAARDVEQVAGQQAVAAAAAASAAAQAASEVASVAQEASQAAQEAAAEVADVVESAKDAQQAALDALYELEALPGSTGFHSQEVQAAIEQMEAEMEGRSYSYLGKSSYEEAMAEIERMEGTGKSVVECLSQEGC